MNIVMQPASDQFMFEVITDSYNFKRYQKYAEKHGLVRDVCTLENMDQEPQNLDDYLKVIQKSDLWLHLRMLAAGTASAVGKLIKGPTKYPTFDQITEIWRDKILEKPFEKTHTMRGHMKWGVGYEDPALIHFAVDNNLSVAQVGTVYLPMSYIIDNMADYLSDGELEIVNKMIDKFPVIKDKHFLVSPDGLVGKPDTGEYGDLPTELLGMLEIKCCSPFHHVQNRDGTLSWVDDMEKRQWYHPGEIPLVYIMQICMQALSGLIRFDMNGDHIMWFMRWSPWGFSEFKITFRPLVQMGIISTVLYLSLKQRITTEQDLPFEYMEYEKPLVSVLTEYYHQIKEQMTHRYIDHFNLYPEFHIYHKVTENFKFNVNDD